MQLIVDRGESHPSGATLVVDDLRVKDDRGSETLQGVSFEMQAGEILGIAGVAGNGQDELVEALIGLRKPSGGSVTLGGRRRHRCRSHSGSSEWDSRSCRATGTASA